MALSRAGSGRLRALVVAAAIVAAAAGGWIGGAHFARGPAQTAALPVLGQAPDYTLTDQRGRQVSARQLRGKVQIVSFLFPYCEEYCPLIAAHLAQFRSVLEGAGLADRVQLIAFNVAAGDAGLEDMRAFMRQYGWDPQQTGLEFLTGPAQAVRDVVQGGFHVPYERVRAESGSGAELRVDNPLAQRVKPDYDIVHNDSLVLVDGEGRVRKIVDQADRVDDPELLGLVRRLLRSG